MAGMLTQGRRVVPKIFRRFSGYNALNHAIRSSRQMHHALGAGQTTKFPLAELPKTQPWARNFHVASVLYQEIKEVKCPGFSESISEGDVRWEKAVGDFVQEDETLGEVETDKTGVPIHSPFAGVIVELLVEDGTTVTAHQPLMKIDVSAKGDAPAKKVETPEPSKPSMEASKEVEAKPASQAQGSLSSPIPSTPPPPPPVPKQPMSSYPTSSVKVTPFEGSVAQGGARTETRTKMTRIRQKTAQRLKESQNTCATLTTFQECDMSNLMEWRKTYKEQFEKKHGVKLGMMSPFIKAAAFGLKNQPIVNAVIDGNEIVYRDYIDVSVAVAAPKGLVVPVIRNVETLSYADIEKAIMEYGEKAKKNMLAIEDMEGGTFSISNGGVFGSLYGTPIINQPQSAILGIHTIKKRPVVVNDQIVIRPIMILALTYDHRLIDGREAVTFLMDIKRAIEDPRVMLLGV
ncbi:dihydrolipoyllysine-residue succinyltransferase component of 2-oxoglutarate dehydrogenase complex, mitochondrial-like isoform X2 [Ostrea edulis]|uniref:dihydrolipoyllysine-residue succinyltransferase component of 2-oxoglutarate dehydrogenase complex, mitochondrial-like isoform X2 n=1 Tax=Ostrea edulis TaxID=37623 RepID=UPI0024AEB2BF|nr:dihydrolipoyllysine-residue succinyltransferase component of 2-oxoglutarate dehydrogenase complex, mitochondrial-like isoform X2 [Ostrea edulis]